MLISYTNTVLETNQQYLCVSRPRRFGKSMALDMLAAYYGRFNDSSRQFNELKIAEDDKYSKYLNKYNVISINMQEFLSNSDNVEEMLTMLKNACFLIFVISTQMWCCLTKTILHLPCRIFIVQKKFHLLF